MKRSTEVKRKLAAVGSYITDAYEAGGSIRELAEAYTTSPGSIRNFLIAEGVQLRSRGRRKKEVQDGCSSEDD
jgi:hypothetical protein